MSVLEKNFLKICVTTQVFLLGWIPTKELIDMKLTQQSAVDHMTYECQTVLI